MTLQEAVSEAMEHKVNGQKVGKNYHLRECVSLWQSSDTFVLAAPSIQDAFFFCELARFEKGANIPLCWGNPDDPGSLVIGQQVPGSGREALLGVLQFMIVGNHVILIESAGLRTSRLEEYLTWLVKQRGNFIPADAHLMLETEFDVSMLGGVDASNIKEIALRPIGLKGTEHGAIAEDVERHEARDTTKESIARQILGLMGSTEADIDRLLAKVPEGGDLQLKLSLLFKRGRAKGATTPSAAVARQAFRNMEDDAIELKTNSGKTVGKLVLLWRAAKVKVNGSIIDFHDAAKVLWEAFEFWVAEGKIENG